MGSTKKQRKKYRTPGHPWQKERIDEENTLIKEYALKNKKEIWRHKSLLENFSNQAKKLTALATEEAKKEEIELLKKTKSLGILKENAKLGDILDLNIKDILERRLQTIIFRKSFARSMNQARQFIIHRHITIKGKKITSPSYLVKKDEEPEINFTSNSSLSSLEHPERAAVIEKKKKK